MSEKRYKIIPRLTEYVADSVTPIGLYLKVRERFPNSLLLESSDYHGEENSFSFVCCDLIASVEISNAVVVEALPDGTRESTPVDEFGEAKREKFERIITRFRERFEIENSSEVSHSAVNGLFGFFAYDAVELMEDITLNSKRVSSEDIPLARYGIYRYVFAIDHFHDKLTVLINGIGEQKEDKELINEIMFGAIPKPQSFQIVGGSESSMTDEEHLQGIDRCKEHIQRGDVFQIVFSRKFKQRYNGDDFNVYRALRLINPSPYLFYFDCGDYRIFGSSPEAQLVVRGDTAMIMPIAGTCPRSGDDDQDRKAVKELLADPKESSEHVMLVDLARNDLSIHCFPVSVDRFKDAQLYSHVIHLVSKVVGKLMPGRRPIAVLAATAPAGTLSGAPKFKAMELIDRYEHGRRQFYGGAIGLISFSGDINHAIMIRTFLSRDGILHSQAGGGIVANSVPAREVEEVKNKLGALRAAVELGAKL